MLRVLGIDTSLTGTGLCRADIVGNTDGGDRCLAELVTATVSAPEPSKDGDRSKRAMARRVNVLIDQIEGAITDGEDEPTREQLPDLIAMEALAYAAKGEGVWVLPWIFGRVIELCEKYDVPLIVVGTSQVKKYALGKGAGPGTDKDHVLAAAIKRWPEAGINSNNEADATVVCAVGCRYLGFPIDQVPKVNQEIMAKVGP